MKRAASLALGLLTLLYSASAQGWPPASQVQRLAKALTGPLSATQVLSQWCRDLGLAQPPIIHAVRDRGISKPADSETRQLLGPEPGEAIGYRRVRLTCGGRTLSEADNWYLPGRLTPVMNKELQETDTPFGLVVAPLSFHRRTLDITPLTGADGVLRVRAVLVSGAGAPFSVVVETYSRALIAVTPPDR